MVHWDLSARLPQLIVKVGGSTAPKCGYAPRAHLRFIYTHTVAITCMCCTRKAPHYRAHLVPPPGDGSKGWQDLGVPYRCTMMGGSRDHPDLLINGPHILIIKNGCTLHNLFFFFNSSTLHNRSNSLIHSYGCKPRRPVTIRGVPMCGSFGWMDHRVIPHYEVRMGVHRKEVFTR